MLGNDEVIAQTSAYFEDFDKPYYKERIEKFELGWRKFILFKEEYVDK